MHSPQPGILAAVPPSARYLSFDLTAGAHPERARDAVAELELDEGLVVGIGPSLARAVGYQPPGLRGFPQLVGAAVDVPSTQAALWCWLRGEDRGRLVHQTREIADELSRDFEPVQAVDAFMYRDGRDLTGYEDGTENPQGERAVKVGILSGTGTPFDGSSFVAVQQWVHDLDYFESLSQLERDHIIGRRASDNEEIDDAPESAHVKRTAQESFEPEAFVVRRSMPWADAGEHGLIFVAFGHSHDAFEAQLRRMVGLDDGIVDGLFRFSRPVSGSYYWCPPVEDGRLVMTRDSA
jgi:putative iron-dependent peroxidase